MSTVAEIPVGVLPDVWWLQACGVTFRATAEVRRNAKSFTSVLVTIQADTPLVYVPRAVARHLRDEVVAVVGRLAVWECSWNWGCFRTRRNDLRLGQSPAGIFEETQMALEDALCREAHAGGDFTGRGTR